MSIRKRELLPVLLLTLAAFALRVWGLDTLLPQQFEWDSYVMGQTVELATDGELEMTAKRRAAYPLLLSRITGLGRVWSDPARSAEPLDLEEHLARCRAPAYDTRLRLMSIATLIVPGTWLLARHFLGAGAALMAAAMVAASLLHASFAGQVRPHAAAATFVLFSLLASMALAQRGTLLRWVLATLAAALALGAFQSGVAVYLPLGVAMLLRARDGWRHAWKWTLPLVAGIGSVLVFYAPTLASMTRGQGGGARLAAGGLRQGTHSVDWSMFNGRGFRQMLRAMGEYEPALLLALALALLVFGGRLFARRIKPARGRELAIVLAYALPYGVVIGVYGRTFQRFLIPLLPFMALFAAWGWGELRAPLTRRMGARAARIGSALAWGLFVVLPAATCARQAWVRSRDDTLEQLAHWIEAEVQEEERVRILRPLHLPPLLRADPAPSALMRPKGVERVYKWNLYEESLPSEAKRGRLWDLDYIEVESPARGGPSTKSARRILKYLATERGADWVALEPRPFRSVPEGYAAWLRAFKKQGRLLARFAPDSHDLYLLYEERHRPPGLPPYFLRIWRASSMGPVIEVYTTALD